MMLKNYYRLTKPGIVYGNSLAALGGFLLAAHGQVELARLIAAVIGLALIIASACVFNNFIDRDIDQLMARTKRRALATGRISGRAALIYGTLLGAAGSALLGLFTNHLTLTLALAGWVLYVVVYTYFKRHTVYGTQIGSLSGAVPPLVGYAAFTGRLDLAAALLFAVMVIWQMPHFYAIAIFRQKDYAAAAVPVLPVKRGASTARRHIIIYMILLTLTVPLFTVFGITGNVFLIETAAVNLAWLQAALGSWSEPDDTIWARRVFRLSLLVLLNLCLMWSVGGLLP